MLEIVLTSPESDQYSSAPKEISKFPLMYMTGYFCRSVYKSTPNLRQIPNHILCLLLLLSWHQSKQCDAKSTVKSPHAEQTASENLLKYSAMSLTTDLHELNMRGCFLDISQNIFGCTCGRQVKNNCRPSCVISDTISWCA